MVVVTKACVHAGGPMLASTAALESVSGVALAPGKHADRYGSQDGGKFGSGGGDLNEA